MAHAPILHERTRCATRCAQFGTAQRAGHAAGTRGIGDNTGRSPSCLPMSTPESSGTTAATAPGQHHAGLRVIAIYEIIKTSCLLLVALAAFH